MNNPIYKKIVPFLLLGIRIYLAYIFIYACYHKILFPETFALDVASYQLLPLFLINITAIILPFTELIAGVSLFIGYKARSGAMLVAAMMIIFIIGLIYALHLDLDMGCGCFASSTAFEEDPISILTVFRDVAWLSLAFIVIIFDKRPFGIDYFIEKPAKQD